MSLILNQLTAFIEFIAHLGAGAVSQGYGYQPELPEELQ